MESKLLLRCEHMYKSFGPTKALQDVCIKVRKGEICGLIGENGSGKSTISSIVAGVQQCDSGEMFWKGQLYCPQNMIEAQEKGIAMIVQENGIIEHITVAANIFVNKEERFCKGLFLDIAKMNEEAKKVLQLIGVDYIDPSMCVDSLNFEDKKLVEIARCMYDNPELLIVDETTTAISMRGRTILYDIMRRMAANKKAVLFISHDLDELIEMCTTVTVLRDGQLITTMTKEQMNVHDMRMNMIGREVSDNYYRSDYDGMYGEEVVLRVLHVSNGPILEDFSVELHKGEILGIGGLSECGMHEVGRAIFGADKILTGTVEVIGKGEIHNPQEAITYGVAYVSKDRDKESIIQNDTIQNNIVLPSVPKLEKKTYISPLSEKKLVSKEIEEMSIKCEGGGQMVNQLSGGNKQKVVFGKWLGNEAEILVLDCPTRGIDVGVKAKMYQTIYELKKAGKSIVLISEELPELIGMSDRILILKEGRLSGTFERSEVLCESDVIHCMI